MINWSNIRSRVAGIVEKLTEQNFRIDVASELYQKFKAALAHRNDLNLPVLGAYWAQQLLDHYRLNDFDIDAKGVLVEVNYYSYLNLKELTKNMALSGTTTYVVDLITDSTDLKKGEDLDNWLLNNGFFEDTLKAKWMNNVAAHWIQEGRLVMRKKKIVKLEDYWNYEDYIYTIRVWDQELNIVVVFICGTYDTYV